MKSLSILVFLLACFFSTRSQILIPFHLVDGFILIDAKVNNKKGKLLFDTGTKMNFFLNNNYLSLNKSNPISSGNAHSGQALTIYSDDISSIEISGTSLKFENLKNVWHANFHFMQEGIAQDILGTIGYESVKEYVFTIDYNRQIIILHEQAPKIPENAIVFSFLQSEDAPNLPFINFNLYENKSIKAFFDTGNQGNITITDSFFSELKERNILSEYNKDNWYGQKLEGNISCTINNLFYNNFSFTIRNIDVKFGSSNEIGLGYSFLKDYISTWDFKKKTITLSKE